YGHMYGKQMASPEDRLEMCRIASEHDKRIKVFDWEICNKMAGETYHVVKLLQDEPIAKHECDFSIMIGMDNALTFHKWYNYHLLERMIRFVVIPRAGYTPDMGAAWYLKAPHIYVPDNKG